MALAPLMFFGAACETPSAPEPSPVSSASPSPRKSARPQKARRDPYRNRGQLPCQEFAAPEPGHVRIELWFWNLYDRSVFPKPVMILRDIPATDAIARAAVEAWIDGPTPSERRKLGAFPMANPDTEVVGLDISDGLASIDLSEEFHATGAGTSSEGQIMTGLVGVVTQFEGVERMKLMWEGQYIYSWGGHGDMLERDGEPRPPRDWYRVVKPCP